MNPDIKTSGNLILTIDICNSTESEKRTAIGMLLSLLESHQPTADEIEWQRKLRDQEQRAREEIDDLTTQSKMSK